MTTRRKFIKQCSYLSLGACLHPIIGFSTMHKPQLRELCLLHSNDTHGEDIPFPDFAPRYAGQGGLQAKADLIYSIRQEKKESVLLLDAGDYFHSGNDNLFSLQNKFTIEAMNAMGYDAACIGEHDFDKGIEQIADLLKHAQFEIIGTNLLTTDNALKDIVKPYSIIEKNGIKTGIVSINKPHKNTPINQGYFSANKLIPKHAHVVLATARHLKKQQKCDIVICLSRLGSTQGESGHWSNIELATASEYIDVIIGGSNHKVLNQVLQSHNPKGGQIAIGQCGWGGTHLGRMDFLFSDKKSFLSLNAQTVEIRK